MGRAGEGGGGGGRGGGGRGGGGRAQPKHKMFVERILPRKCIS